MSFLKDTADSKDKKSKVESDTRKDSRPDEDRDAFSPGSKETDPLTDSNEDRVSGFEGKKPTSSTEDRDEAVEKNKVSRDTKQKEAESPKKASESSSKSQDKEAVAENKDAPPKKLGSGSSEDKEKAESLMKANDPESRPKDLLYLFQKYADVDEATKGKEIITLDLLKKWLNQAELFDEESGITEEYIIDIFKKSNSKTDVIDFDEFQTLLYNIAEENTQIYSELVHKLLTAGKPYMESTEDEDFYNAVVNSIESHSNESSVGKQSKDSKPESSDSNKEKNDK